MSKLRQILQFIKALLGFLLNLKKKETDEKKENVVTPGNQPAVARVLPGDIGVACLVGGPYRNRPGLYRSPVDTLGLRQTTRHQLAIGTGNALMLYAAASCLLRLLG